jgi:hypothetical protein
VHHRAREIGLGGKNMGEIIDFGTGRSADKKRDVNEAYNESKENEGSLARRARLEIETSGKILKSTKVQLAMNLGKILDRFGRELSRNLLARNALGTSVTKPSERLGLFQIKPGKEPSQSKIEKLSKNANQYLRIAEVAAELTESDSNLFVLELVEGTRFDPSGGSEFANIAPIQKLSELIKARCELIAEKYNVAEYFELTRRYSVYSEGKDVLGNTKFVSDYDMLLDFPPPETEAIASASLFWISLFEGECSWRPFEGNWILRQAQIEEHVRFDLFCNSKRGVFGGVVVSPYLFLPATKSPNGDVCLKEERRELPDNLGQSWIVGDGAMEYPSPWAVVTSSAAVWTPINTTTTPPS